MMLVADVDTIKGNLTPLSDEIESFTKSLSTFNSENLKCPLEEVSGVLESYKSTIGEELNKLDTSSKEYKDLVKECCKEYKKNEANTKEIDAQAIIDIITNCKEITSDYKGNAASALTGLPSTELYLAEYFDPDFKYLEGGMAIPYFNQYDYADVSLGSGKTIASSGCGFTACCMIASYLSRTKVTPRELVKWAKGYYVNGAGMSWSLPAATAKHYGLGTVTKTSSINEVYKALKEGKPVMSAQRPGLFTRNEHLIVLRGVDDKGKILVNDPNGENAIGKKYNEKSFTKEEIARSGTQYFIFNADGDKVKAVTKGGKSNE